jgi:hypothetical protein
MGSQADQDVLRSKTFKRFKSFVHSISSRSLEEASVFVLADTSAKREEEKLFSTNAVSGEAIPQSLHSRLSLRTKRIDLQ